MVPPDPQYVTIDGIRLRGLKDVKKIIDPQETRLGSRRVGKLMVGDST